MLSRVQDHSTRVVYVSTLVVGTGYGVSIALTALRLHDLSFTNERIGWLAAVFASGIVLASLPMAWLIDRFSAKTMLVASLAGYALCVGLFPFLDAPITIGFVRFFDGACSVTTWICFETILLRRAESHQKAYVMSIYAIAIALGYMLGPLLAMGIVTFVPMRLAFLASSALALAACGYVTFSLDRAEAERPIANASEAVSSGPPMSVWRVLGRIKTSLFGTFAYGYFQASVVLFLPLYLIAKKGVAESQTILIPAFFAAGMLLFSNYSGKLGDRIGHLRVMRTLAIIGTCMVAGFIWIASFPLMCAAIFVAGATLASISPVSLALQGVVVESSSYGRANALYNGVYAAGMLVGPPISSIIFDRAGGGAMLAHLAALWGSFVVFSIVFWRDDPAARRRAGEGSTGSGEGEKALGVSPS